MQPLSPEVSIAVPQVGSQRLRRVELKPLSASSCLWAFGAMSYIQRPYFQSHSNAEGYFGRFDGDHYPPELRAALEELASSYQELYRTPELQTALNKARAGLQGRPIPIHYREHISNQVGGAQVFNKRDLPILILNARSTWEMLISRSRVRMSVECSISPHTGPSNCWPVHAEGY